MADENKLIIDEDWKSQVQAEKDEAAKAKASPAPQPDDVAENLGDVPMPPASLELLLTMLATEALIALGQVPSPVTGKPHLHRNQAKYLIDMIEVLQSKTQGNLSDGEQQLIESMLHQLRMVFVETANQTAPTPAADTTS